MAANQTDKEGYRGVGRADRRRMIRMWRASGTDQSLKEWAAQQGVGDIADVWVKSKRSPNGPVRRDHHG